MARLPEAGTVLNLAGQPEVGTVSLTSLQRGNIDPSSLIRQRGSDEDDDDHDDVVDHDDDNDVDNDVVDNEDKCKKTAVYTHVNG